MIESGVQFVAQPDGRRSSIQAGRAIWSAALDCVDPSAAQAARREPDWRKRYPRYLAMLAEALIRHPDQVLPVATTALAEAWQQVEFLRDGNAMPLVEAMRRPQPDSFVTFVQRGRGSAAIEPWSVPYRGQRLQGDALRAQIARWEARGILEPDCAEALLRVLNHPEWLDLSDRALVLLGAGAEAGPLAPFSRWRATIVAVDVADPARWQRIAELMAAGNGTLIVPLRQPVAPDAAPAQWSQCAGADLLTQTPELAAWLLSLNIPLDIATLAYLDGERHARVALAMDAIVATVSAARPDTTLMSMATPTDLVVVGESIAQAALRNAAATHPLRALATGAARVLSGGRLLQPHLRGLIASSNGQRYGIVDGLFIEQGPNYALAKRLQQWRALIARASGQRVSINVAPSTMTRSVIKHPALKAGYNGADLFGVEIFAPETTSALMAALWVHDLRYPGSAANPATPLTHPLDLITAQACHGGLWRSGFLPRSAMPIAALIGIMRRPCQS